MGIIYLYKCKLAYWECSSHTLFFNTFNCWR